MKKTCITLLFLLLTSSLFAGHSFGGFEYELVDPVQSVYRIRLTLYRYCAGIPAMTQETVNFTSSNNVSIPSITIMAKPPLNQFITPRCNSNYNFYCSNPVFNIPMYYKYVYEAIVQLDTAYGIVTVSYSSCCRPINSYMLNTLDFSTSTSIYLEMKINTKIPFGSNSVTFNEFLIPILGAGNKLYYNFGGRDNDNDSIVYSLFNPKASDVLNLYYKPGFNYVKPLNMLENTINFNSENGALEFTPTSINDASIFGVTATKYRKFLTSAGKDTFLFVGSNSLETNIHFYFNSPKINIQGVLNNNKIKNAVYVANNKLNICNLEDTIKFNFIATAENLPLYTGLDISWNTATANNQFIYKKIEYTKVKDSVNLKDTIFATVSFIPSSSFKYCKPIYLRISHCNDTLYTFHTYAISICNTKLNFNPTVSVTTDTSTICQGIPVNFKANQSIAGYKPVFNWFKNSVFQGIGDSFTVSNLKNNDTIWSTVNSNSYCQTANNKWYYSNKKIVSVTDTIHAVVALTKDRDTLCSGDTMLISALPGKGSINPTYQWYLNNTLLSFNTSTFNSSSLQQNDQIYVRIKLNQNCMKSDSAVSNTLIIQKQNKVTPTFQIQENQLPVCAGDSVLFTITATQTGSNPRVYWYKNNALIDSNNLSLKLAIQNLDSVFAYFKSSLTCLTKNNIPSNLKTYQVQEYTTPTIKLNASHLNPCKNELATINSITTNGGNTPKFYWYKNFILVDSSGPQYQFNVNNFNWIYCVFKSDKSCLYSNNIISDTLYSYPSTPIQTKLNIACQSANIEFYDTAFFYAKAIDMGTNPVFTWYINSKPIPNFNKDTIYIPGLKNRDTVFCTLSSTLNCALENPVTSNKIVMKVTSSIEELGQQQIYSVYPNPTNHSIHLKQNHPLKNTLHVILRNTTGMLVGETYWHPNQMNHTLDIQHLNAGMYMLELNDAESTQTFKLIKE